MKGIVFHWRIRKISTAPSVPVIICTTVRAIGKTQDKVWKMYLFKITVIILKMNLQRDNRLILIINNLGLFTKKWSKRLCVPCFDPLNSASWPKPTNVLRRKDLKKLIQITILRQSSLLSKFNSINNLTPTVFCRRRPVKFWLQN